MKLLSAAFDFEGGIKFCIEGRKLGAHCRYMLEMAACPIVELPAKFQVANLGPGSIEEVTSVV